MRKADFSSTINSVPKPSFMANDGAVEQLGINDQPTDKKVDSPRDIGVDTPSYATVHDADEIWKIVKEYLRMNVSEREMKAWYENVYLESIANGVAVISCDNAIKREWIESYHKSFIRNKIEEIIGYKPDLMITIRTAINAKSENDPSKKYAYFNPKQHKTKGNSDQVDLFGGGQQASERDSRENNPYGYGNVNPKYLLSNFVVGNSNQLAHAVAQSASENPGVLYNPIFFYGPSGVGKTHLMQGIANAILHRDPSAKVLYAPIETFMNEMIQAIKTNKNEDFRNKYRPADVLIIDDIQFISTYTKTKEELFNTFNALYMANKQIVIASDKPPNEMDNLPDRLRTRFQGGMVVDIHSPDLETRIAILQQEAAELRSEVPENIIMFIAQHIENSVRELQGAINKVITLAKISGEMPTLESVAKMLQVDVESKRKRVSPDDVINSVADVFDVSKKDITGSRRTAYIATARQVVMYLLREELQLPLEKVAQCVNRKDHTTVLHACEKIELGIKENNRLGEKIERCRAVFVA